MEISDKKQTQRIVLSKLPEKKHGLIVVSGFQVYEPTYDSRELMLIFSCGVIKLGNNYFLWKDDAERDYIRCGPRIDDFLKAIIPKQITTEYQAMSLAKWEALTFARELAEHRNYTGVDDRT